MKKKGLIISTKWRKTQDLIEESTRKDFSKGEKVLSHKFYGNMSVPS